ncbi:hypothetical protein AC579_909 [Pseudocercospora musae]|uniref:Uncharacterized protein n=1 Tax=Pseudocercospora musae TaxID=113226 RepID=A0A139INT9_9PEZI|nr:hypothetical protein AC579_909 [Pseudocercospora musae]
MLIGRAHEWIAERVNEPTPSFSPDLLQNNHSTSTRRHMRDALGAPIIYGTLEMTGEEVASLPSNKANRVSPLLSKQRDAHGRDAIHGLASNGRLSCACDARLQETLQLVNIHQALVTRIVPCLIDGLLGSKHEHKLEVRIRSAKHSEKQRDYQRGKNADKTERVGHRPYSDDLVGHKPKLAYGLVWHGGYDYLPGVNGYQAENKQCPGRSNAIPTTGRFERENVQ